MPELLVLERPLQLSSTELYVPRQELVTRTSELVTANFSERFVGPSLEELRRFANTDPHHAHGLFLEFEEADNSRLDSCWEFAKQYPTVERNGKVYDLSFMFYTKFAQDSDGLLHIDCLPESTQPDPNIQVDRIAYNLGSRAASMSESTEDPWLEGLKRRRSGATSWKIMNGNKSLITQAVMDGRDGDTTYGRAFQGSHMQHGGASVDDRFSAVYTHVEKLVA